MPHAVREEHLEDICNNCKKPHGNNITLEPHEGKMYEIIKCINCGYEIIRLPRSTDPLGRKEFQRDEGFRRDLF